MSKIRSKVHNYGDKNESSWPPRFPKKNNSGKFYWDHEEQKFKEGYPPRKEKVYEKAPVVIQDSITPYYHPKACAIVDSRSKLRDIDKACGTITSDKQIPADPSWAREQQRARDEDRRESVKRAIAQIDSDPGSVLTDEQRYRCAEDHKRMQDGLPGFDPFNAAGRKNDKRGKKRKR